MLAAVSTFLSIIDTGLCVATDPMMTGFDGRPFEFVGEPNTYYSIISERHHKVCRGTRSLHSTSGSIWRPFM